MELSYQQYVSMMRILLDIIHADGRIDAREEFYYNELKDEFHLTDEDHAVVEKKNSLLALAQIKEMNDDEKDYFAKLMSRMIIVDEDINVNEVAIYELVCEFCGIKLSFVEAAGQESVDPCSHS